MKKIYLALIICTFLYMINCSSTKHLLEKNELVKDVYLRHLMVANFHDDRNIGGNYRLKDFPPGNVDVYCVYFYIQNKGSKIVHYDFTDTFLEVDGARFNVLTSATPLKGEIHPSDKTDSDIVHDSHQHYEWAEFYIVFYIPRKLKPTKLILSNFGEYDLSGEWEVSG